MVHAHKAAFARTLVLVLPATLVLALLSKHLNADTTRRIAIAELYHASDTEAMRSDPLAPAHQNQYFTALAPTCSEPERAALFRAGVKLAGSRSAEWLQRSGWGEAADCCDWKGVGCASGRGVETLSLPHQGLRGTLPSELGLLRGLLSLDVNENKGLSGTLPSELLGSRRLKSLYAFSAALSGTLPEAIARASSLHELELSSCRLSGTLPSALGATTRLSYVFLEANRVSGVIPSALSGLRRLQELELSHNRLSGSVPGRLAHMPLQHLDVADNAPGLKGAPIARPTQGCSGGSEKYLRGASRGAGSSSAGSSSAGGSSAGVTRITYGQNGVPKPVEPAGEAPRI